jgi:hypothetical protein
MLLKLLFAVAVIFMLAGMPIDCSYQRSTPDAARFTRSAIHHLGRCLSKKAHITSAAFGSRGEEPSILRAR